MEQEEEVINDLAHGINRIQTKVQEKARKLDPPAAVERGFHAKGRRREG